MAWASQKKTYLPHFANHTKEVASLWKLKVHITGAMVQWEGNRSFVYGRKPVGTPFQFTREYSVQNPIYGKILFMVKNITQVLYLQLDNCFRENKNKYVFTFLCQPKRPFRIAHHIQT
jgi:hypothetical protein